MDNNQHIKILQMVYAGALADTVLQFNKEGVLENVIRRKRQEQINTGKMRAAQFAITKPEDVFLKLYEIFGCSNWEIISDNNGGITAQANSCMLCAIAKKIGAPSPCYLYCLNPMEGIVKALNSDVVYTVEETLWEGSRCIVKVDSNVR